MKCEIIRDLLPSYVDGLTSEASNEAVEEHLAGCESCRKYFEELRQEEPKILEKVGGEIDYFLRVQEENLKKVLIAVVATIVVFSTVFGAYKNYYGYKQVCSSEVVTEVQIIDNVSALVFEAVEEPWNISFGYTQNSEVKGRMPLCTINLSKVRRNPFHYLPPENRALFSFREREKVAVDLSFLPEEIVYEDSDFIAIRFSDCVKTITLADLRDGDISSLQ